MRTAPGPAARTGALTALVGAATLFATGCSPTQASEPAAPTTLTVLAAASLTDVFAELGDRFEAEHPGVDVRLSFAGSASLVAQAVQGVPADVLATASRATMADAVAAEVAADPVVVAGNALVIAVPSDNPGQVTTLADLADPARTVVMCAPQVPCGAAAVQAFDGAGLTPAPDSLEQDVRAVLTKVVLGEADAGLVYATDVQAAGGAVRGIAIPDAPVNDYLIAILTGTGRPALAQDFVDLVRSPAGRETLSAAGFQVEGVAP